MSEANEAKGCALRVGHQILVPPNATEADIVAALEMMTPEERKRTAKQLSRDLKWTMWQMKYPILAAILEAGAECGYAMLGARF